MVNNVVRSCNQCESLKKIPKEVLEQSSTSSPEQPGKLFAADVIHRHGQKFFVVRDAYSSFTVASFIPDENTILRKLLL